MCGYAKFKSKCGMVVCLKIITDSYTESLPQYPAVGKKTTSSAVVRNAELLLHNIVPLLVINKIFCGGNVNSAHKSAQVSSWYWRIPTIRNRKNQISVMLQRSLRTTTSSMMSTNSAPRNMRGWRRRSFCILLLKIHLRRKRSAFVQIFQHRRGSG